MNETDQKKYKILLVDDDNFLLNMYESKFKKYGHEVIRSTDGEEALSKLREGLLPDIIILDVIMPHIDGMEILKVLREEKLAENSSVIMLTNQGDSREIEKAKHYNIDGYIVKAALIPSEVVVEVLRIAEDRTNKQK